MNCDKVQDLLSEAIDGALSPAEARDFDAHLADCPPCRALLGDLKESLAVLEELPSVEVGDDFDAAVWKRLRAERRLASARTVRSRVRDWLSAFGLRGSLRWVPLGAAAAVLGWVALSSAPDQMIRASMGTAEASRVASVGSGTKSAEEAASPDIEALSHNPDFTPVEFSAGMPRAVEQFLSSDQDLTPRYRRSNYNYPFRPVRDPIVTVPVSTGGVAIESPNPTTTTTETGVPVLAF
ncbi:MAG: zf-HC2 domain-containing protein [bacterium]